MPEYRPKNIDQRDANNEKTNGKMQLHVRHNQSRRCTAPSSAEPGAVAYPRSQVGDTRDAWAKVLDIGSRADLTKGNSGIPRSAVMRCARRHPNSTADVRFSPA